MRWAGIAPEGSIALRLSRGGPVEEPVRVSACGMAHARTPRGDLPAIKGQGAMADLLTISPGRPKKPTGIPLLAHGFRPFFLLASGYGALFPPLWLAAFLGTFPVATSFPAVVWHGHEMVFGFASAAVCGFFLTATSTWSRIPPVTGARLAALVGLWTAGRTAIWFSSLLHPAVVALLDLALFPVLAMAVLPVLITPGNRHNLLFLLVLGLFFLANGLVHLEVWAGFEGAATEGLRLGVNLLALLIVIIIGRIVPTFLNVERLGRGNLRAPASRTWLEGLAIGSAALFVILDAFLSESAWAGAMALASAGIQLVRMAVWRAGRLLRKSFLWALHLGYAWLAVGLGLIGWAYLDGPVPWISGLHALTVGGIGTMVLAVMSIVSLLHTGRPAEIHPAVISAYLLVSAAALIRALAPVVMYESYREALAVSGLLWGAAFLLYLWIYLPILTRPRPDGIPG